MADIREYISVCIMKIDEFENSRQFISAERAETTALTKTAEEGFNRVCYYNY